MGSRIGRGQGLALRAAQAEARDGPQDRGRRSREGDARKHLWNARMTARSFLPSLPLAGTELRATKLSTIRLARNQAPSRQFVGGFGRWLPPMPHACERHRKTRHNDPSDGAYLGLNVGDGREKLPLGIDIHWPSCLWSRQSYSQSSSPAVTAALTFGRGAGSGQIT